MINAEINGLKVSVEDGVTILEAARRVNIRIPTLCKHPDLFSGASCGICIVRLKDSPRMPRACCTPLEEGMSIVTHDPEIVAIRRTVLEMFLSHHPNECLTCGRNNNCELQKMLADFGIREEMFEKFLSDQKPDHSTGSIVLDPRKCIQCGRCVDVCQNMQDVWALSFLDRGFGTRMAPAGDIPLADSPCVRCGQCSAHCPTGAIFEHDQTGTVWETLRHAKEKGLFCVAQIAPAVRTGIGEAFLCPDEGANMTGKLYALLRRIGFHAVFDTNFGADVTIMEEASEFVHRFRDGSGPLPLITTCCPSWVDFMEKFHADMIPHFSSCKSPHQLVGALAKTWYAGKNGLDPARVFVVSIMPCTAKKYEISRTDDMFSSGHQDVDVSLTTRELSRMIKQAGIDFTSLPDEEPDHIMGDYAGAGVIFGATGGVMEAALRTAYHQLTGDNLAEVEITSVRGLEGVKEASIEVAGQTVRLAVAHGLANVELVLEKIRSALRTGREAPYHFVEVMACPGGCVGGGGQPYGVNDELRRKRSVGLYEDDRGKKVRCSHENPQVQRLYREFLGAPLSAKCEKLLHNRYKSRPSYKR